MHRSFLEYLVDPSTRRPLELAVREASGDVVHEGVLLGGERSYPIIRGVPRFAGFASEERSVRSFAYQWAKWSRVQFESENAGGPMAGHTTRMWERITAIRTDDLGGALIGDFGCGPGRFIEVVRWKRGRVIALDVSNAVDAARQNFADDPGVLICQADLLRPPLKEDCLDGAFSIGVLHHTPDPARALEEIVRTVRPGGWVAISVYGRGGYYDRPMVRFWRRLFQLLWPVLGHRPALAYAYLAVGVVRPLARLPVVGLALRTAFPVVALADARWSLLDTFDSVTPVYQSTHTSQEVHQWFRQSGLGEIAPSDWGVTAYHAVRK